MNKWKTSTKIYALITVGFTAAMTWIASPDHLPALQHLLGGHPQMLMILNGAIALWNLRHTPKQ